MFDYLSVNTTAISTEKGIVIIDSHRSPAIMLKIKKLVELEFDREDFAYVINTHGHWDHCSGNQIFTNTKIVAHHNCSEYLNNNPANSISMIAGIKHRISKINDKLINSDENSNEYIILNEELDGWELILEDLDNNYIVTPPSLTFNDSLKLELGDFTIKLIYCGRAHTDNHIFINIPQANLVFTGDMFSSTVNFGFSVNKMIEVPRIIDAIDQALSNGVKNKLVIPGHGKFLSGKDLIYLREKLIERYAEFENKKSYARFLEEMIGKFSLNIAIEKFDELISSQMREYYLLEAEFTILGNRFLGNGKVDEAIEVFKTCTNLFPTSVLAYDNLATAYLKKGDFNLAIENYEKSLAIFPDNEITKNIIKSLRYME
jgi:glyoxylase-like metal-dependent hydrolase (beta-lactamase superfamily II)